MKLKAAVEATESDLLHELAKVSGNYEAKMDKQHSIAMGAQELLEVKLREEISQVAREADAHHQEEQNLRKLGIKNLDSKIFCKWTKILLRSWRNHGMLVGSLKNQGEEVI